MTIAPQLGHTSGAVFAVPETKLPALSADNSAAGAVITVFCVPASSLTAVALPIRMAASSSSPGTLAPQDIHSRKPARMTAPHFAQTLSPGLGLPASADFADAGADCGISGAGCDPAGAAGCTCGVSLKGIAGTDWDASALQTRQARAPAGINILHREQRVGVPVLKPHCVQCACDGRSGAPQRGQISSSCAGGVAVASAT